MEAMILLVDDEPVVLTVLHRILRTIVPTYDVITAPDGATALTLFAQRPVALVITDQHMPNMDGVALTVAIKAVAPQCPVILITGSPTPEIHQRGQAAGVDFFLPKPFRVEQFAAIVRAALAQ
jgi:CheY-like chemotaxis protein